MSLPASTVITRSRPIAQTLSDIGSQQCHHGSILLALHVLARKGLTLDLRLRTVFIGSLEARKPCPEDKLHVRCPLSEGCWSRTAPGVLTNVGTRLARLRTCQMLPPLV